MKKKVCIVHYNTPEFTTAAIQSVWKHTPDCEITVFDNSNKRPLPPIGGVNIIDNTEGQIIDFGKWLSGYPNKRPTPSNWGSEKHMCSIEWLYQHFEEGFLLLDSDVLVRKDISPFFNDSYAWIGQWEDPPVDWHHARRLIPYCLWINAPMCKAHGITFMSEGRIFEVSYTGRPWYDTGASFYEDCEKAQLPKLEVVISQYALHYGSGSWKFGKRSWRAWLEGNKYLYDMAKKTTTTTKKQKDDRILVVIPYCSAGAQGKELQYAVAGWRRHFKENYLIVLAGEYNPIVETGDDIICIESERVPPKDGQYRQHLDYVSCLKKVHAAFPDSDGFIMVADDCYAVNDFDINDVKFLKQKADEMGGSLSSPNGWQRDKARTRIKLTEEGYPTRNFTTHLPQWYEWDKLEALWEHFDMENTSYVMEDLYYNIYYSTRIPLQLHIDYDNLKCGVYRPDPRIPYIERAFKKQIWITNSPAGWIPQLDKMLSDYYGI